MSSGKVRGRLRDLELSDDLVSDDPRHETAMAVMDEKEIARPTIAALFSGTPLATDHDRLDKLLNARSLIQEQWGKTKEAFITIGRALVRIERMLSTEEYRRFCAEMAKIMPFSASNASKFRMVAIAVDEGRLPEKALPASFGTAYELSTLDEAGLRIAASRQLIRPDVDRAAVMALKRDLKKGVVIDGVAETGGEATGKVSVSALRKNRDRIQREIDKLDDKRKQLVRELADAEARIVEVGGAE